MDRKSVAILIFSILGMVIWYKSINQMYPPKPTPQAVAENQEAPSVNPTLTETAGSPGEQEGNTPLTAPVGVEASARILEMESLDYNFTSLGGGIESILLRDFNVTTRREEDDSTTEEKVQLNHHLEIPAMSVLFGSLNAASPMPYQLSQQGDQIMATTQTEEGLRVTKTFTPTTNYVIQASIRIENTSEQGMNVPEHYVVTGSTGPTTPEDKDLYMGLRYGYEDEVEEVKEGWFANRTLGCFPGTPRTTYASEYGPIRWASVDNQFFAMIAIPEKPAAFVPPHLRNKSGGSSASGGMGSRSNSGGNFSLATVSAEEARAGKVKAAVDNIAKKQQQTQQKRVIPGAEPVVTETAAQKKNRKKAEARRAKKLAEEMEKNKV